MRVVALAVAVLAMAGCTSSSVLDIDSDTIQVTTSAAPVCGQIGAQQVAAKRAAIETLKRGYDKYIILGGAYQNDVQVVGTTPYVANTYGSGTVYGGYGNTATYSGHSTTYVSGGSPIIAGSHDQALTVKMFRKGDPAGGKAIDARQILGPKWQKAMAEGANGTC